MSFASVDEILCPTQIYQAILSHARRKLRGDYLRGEEPERKAYGLLGAELSGNLAHVAQVFPLTRNFRYQPPVSTYFDDVVRSCGVPSETPFEQRGWMADPVEVLLADRECDRAGTVLFGSYHVHRVRWDHDPVRDRCTELDRRLAEASSLWILVLSMVDETRPILRAFYEGSNDQEAPVRILAADPQQDATAG